MIRGHCNNGNNINEDDININEIIYNNSNSINGYFYNYYHQ